MPPAKAACLLSSESWFWQPAGPPLPPCVGCGWCCLADQCEVSHRLHGYQARCPELYWSDTVGCYRCALMSHPQYGELARRSCHAGKGCCAPLNTWRKDIRKREDEE